MAGVWIDAAVGLANKKEHDVDKVVEEYLQSLVTSIDNQYHTWSKLYY